jgi:hypothetical protein
MESSRDSSVWRNLAVTFGGGLALGAVGMKLTQTALRPVDVTPRPEPNPNPLADRLSSMERRLERVEQTPVSPRAAAAGQAMAAPIDQKVLEAVIGAVDARLHEHAGQMDRRLADLEARMAVDMQGLRQQDRQAGEQSRQEAALRSELEQEMRQVRESVSRTLAGEHAELQTLRKQNERIVDAAEQRFADMRREYSHGLADLRESVFRALDGQAAAQEQKFSAFRSEMEQSVEARIVTTAATAAAAQMEEQLAPMRAEVRQKEHELAELRQRLAESEGSVLDVVLAIGALCRQAADRIGAPPEPRPTAPTPAPGAPIAETHSKAEEAEPALADPGPIAVPLPASPPALPPTMETPPVTQAVADPALAQAIPDFLQDTNRRTSWRIPLVSSLLVSTGYLVLMHYLAAPLQ